MQQMILAPGEGLSVENPLGGLFTFKITSDESDGTLTAIERSVEAFARVAAEMKAFEVVGPPLAESDPL